MYIYTNWSIKPYIHKSWSNGLGMGLILRKQPMVMGSSQPAPLVNLIIIIIIIIIIIFTVAPQGRLQSQHPWRQNGVGAIIQRCRQRHNAGSLKTAQRRDL